MAAEESRYLLAHPASDPYLRVQNKKLYLATFAAVLGPLSFGFVLGYSSPAVPELKKVVNPKLRLDSNQASWFAVYISEISHTNVRGMLGSFVQLMVVTGILGTYIAGIGVKSLQKKKKRLSLFEFKNPSVYRPLLIGVILMFLQQVTGINAVMFYAETIFEDANFQCYLPYTLLFEMHLTCIYFLLFVIIGFALGWGPVPWLVMSEIFPLKARGISSGACVLTNWVMAFLVTKEFQDFIGFLTSYGTFWLFSAFCCLSVTFTAFYVPETKGRTLEQIEAYFRKS
ncbi:hypothetical protein ASZ78_005626 [Callipepla squamata]|uniref:Major facilitator superfamily (MFS) profile domain-containing protein n=1 Tax=Callipepla squamata TaxID=9009 RepID=A0A226NHA1_CALSU|nr:hypothetical protein ASZ78_005626 [Callipepla squamata]